MKPYLVRCRNDFIFSPSPSTFFVEEVPLFRPAKRGRYAILKIQKRSLSTFELLKILRKYTKSVGYAGLKDKHATTIQYLSIDSRDLPAILSLHDRRFKVLEYFKSKEPIKIGDLAGNRFRILLRHVKDPKSIERCLEMIEEVGMPNYFGYQRFGKEGLGQAKAYVQGNYHPKTKEMERFLLKIYQSDLFNRWLAERVKMSEGRFKELPGDLYQVDGRLIASNVPLYKKEAIPTGLLPGTKVLHARLEAGKIERRFDDVIECRGERREAIVYPKELRIEREKGELWLTFFLPKGSYATILIENLLGRELR